MRALILFRFPNDVTEDFPKPGIALSLQLPIVPPAQRDCPLGKEEGYKIGKNALEKTLEQSDEISSMVGSVKASSLAL